MAAASLALAALLAAGAPPFDPDAAHPPLPARPADLTLRPAQAGAPRGRVWVEATAAGLVVRGAVEGPAPRFAAREEDLDASDRVELSLAAARDPALPPGPLRTLFARRWAFSGHVVAETLAGGAFAALRRPIGALEPREGPAMRTRAEPGRGWDFEVHVPWGAFPPLDALTVRDLRLVVEIAGPARSRRASTAPGHRAGRPATFPKLRLAAPRTFRVSACDDALAGKGPGDRNVPAWFLPPAEGDLVEELIVVARGPGAPVRTEARASLAVGPDTWVCLPHLSVRRGAAVYRLGLAVPEGATLKRVAGGSLLLSGGARSFLIAPDWSRVEVLERPRRGDGAARAVRALCLRGDRYRDCAPPSRPRR